MNNKEIHEKILSAIEEHADVKISKKYTLNGYYIFDFGEDSVCHFQVNGLKRWLFGIWLSKDDKTNNTKVIIFGENTDFIDKFKPTATAINGFELERDFDKPDEDQDACWDTPVCCFAWLLRRIKRNPLVFRFYYYHEYKGLARSLLEDLWWYRIRKPITDFLEQKAIPVYLKIVKTIYTLRFKTRKNNFHINIENLGEGWSPQHVFQIVYDGCDDDEIERIYWKIWVKRKYLHPIDEEKVLRHRAWLVPFNIFFKCEFRHSENDDDKRGFWYEEEK